MTTNYTHILDLAKEAESPADGILSKTIYQDDQIKAVVFGFGQGNACGLRAPPRLRPARRLGGRKSGQRRGHLEIC